MCSWSSLYIWCENVSKLVWFQSRFLHHHHFQGIHLICGTFPFPRPMACKMAITCSTWSIKGLGTASNRGNQHPELAGVVAHIMSKCLLSKTSQIAGSSELIPKLVAVGLLSVIIPQMTDENSPLGLWTGPLDELTLSLSLSLTHTHTLTQRLLYGLRWGGRGWSVARCKQSDRPIAARRMPPHTLHTEPIKPSHTAGFNLSQTIKQNESSLN